MGVILAKIRQWMGTGFAKVHFRAGVVTALLMLFLITAYLTVSLAPAGPKGSPDVVVDIPSSAGAHAIGRLLYDKGLIRSTLSFTFYLNLTGYGKRLQAGEYNLNPALSVPQIVDKLVRGQVIIHTITIPEGYTVQEIAELLARDGFGSVAQFEKLASSIDPPGIFGSPPPGVRYPLEGYLFPDTYRVTKGMDERSIITMMLQRFQEQISALHLQKGAARLGLTPQQVITLASLVEKEAKLDRERPLIAGVLLHRLHLGMPLQVDASIEYALGRHKDKITLADLQVNSPYNTYKHRGLPPGPIASPGKASLEAVLHPAHTDYLYYVAKGDGSHAFSRSYAEQEANIRKYLH